MGRASAAHALLAGWAALAAPAAADPGKASAAATAGNGTAAHTDAWDAAGARPDDDAVTACLSCHLDEAGRLDIVGVAALSALPPEWPFLFEDQFDLDGDGVAGRMRFVSGADGPMSAKFGQALAAARFEDFARIAGAAHDIDLSGPGVMDRLEAAFEARSPAPVSPFASPSDLARFEAEGCARCHVTRSFDHAGQRLMPLSDFLLHDLGEGPRRTAPLWGCPDCVRGPAPHPEPGPALP